MRRSTINMLGKTVFVMTFALGGLPVALPTVAKAYPTDAVERTGIRRLPWQQAIDQGERRGRASPPGAQWPSAAISLRLTKVGKNFELTADTPKDRRLQAGLEAILKRYRWRHYNVAILDISDPSQPRFAGVNESELQTPGSVAKLLVAAGLFAELQKRFPNAIAEREALLKNTMVAADSWLMPNSHEVPVVKGDKVSVRRVRSGDTFSLWEWLDHALSPSSNAAATMVWREAMLLRLLGEAYPPNEGRAKALKQWSKDELTAAAMDTLSEPLDAANIDKEQLFLRMFFTKGAGKHIKSDTSRASPLALLQYWLRVEQGRLVDEFSSLEIKRLLYLTRRRIRYSKAKELNDSAVYFKSGSLFGCKPEEGFTCIQYQGNTINVLNSLTAVEVPWPAPEPTVAQTAAPEAAAPEKSTDKSGNTPNSHTKSGESGAQSAKKAPNVPPAVKNGLDEARPPMKTYMIAVMSNELRRNAANDHEALAAAVHKLILGYNLGEEANPSGP